MPKYKKKGMKRKGMKGKKKYMGKGKMGGVMRMGMATYTLRGR